MTLVINLTPAEEARLSKAAEENGMLPEEYARQLIANLPWPEGNTGSRVPDKLRALGRNALRDHASGRTDEFPV